MAENFKTPECSKAVSTLQKPCSRKRKRIALDDEEFSQRLKQIISRDYFPELSQLKIQEEYLNAKESNNLPKIRELQERYSMKRLDRRTTPLRYDSPENFDTRSPCSYRSFKNAYERAAEFADQEDANSTSELERYTVDSFLNNYTSSDDKSFEEIIDSEKERERIKNAWMYEAEIKHNKELITRLPEPVQAADEQLMIAAAPVYSQNKPKDLDNWGYKARNTILFNIEEAPLTMEERLIRQKQNSKVINRSATRLSHETRQKLSRPSTSRCSTRIFNKSGQVDINGRDVSEKQSNEELVASPSPSPGVDDSPFMTWGELGGTPFHLDASDIISVNSPSTSAFKIPELPIRDKIAQVLRDKTAKNYRDKRKSAAAQSEIKEGSSTPRSSSRIMALSPAARNLVSQKFGIRLSSDRKLDVDFTPSRTPGSLTRSSASFSSPVVRKGFKRSTEKVLLSNSSITDNLLNFGKSSDEQKSRPSATDFF